MKIIGYYKENHIVNEEGSQDEKNLYIVVFENSYKDGSKTWLEGYNIMQGHFELKDKSYLSSCEKITKEEYMQATKGWFTPSEYLEVDEKENKFLLRVNNSINIIVETDYKILSDAFVKKVQSKLIEAFGKEAHATIDFLKSKLSPINAGTFKMDAFGNYEYDFVNGFGTLRAETVHFFQI